MTVEVNLQISGIDLRHHDAHDLIETHLADYAFAVVAGIPVMTVFSDGDVVADTVQAVRCARHHNITVEGVLEDRVNADEIARRIGGKTRETVRKWTQEATFPVPRNGSDNARGASYRWDWAEVLPWLTEHKGLDLDENLPTRKQAAALNAIIAGVTDYASDAVHRVLNIPAESARTAVVFHHEAMTSLVVTTRDWDRVKRVAVTAEAHETSATSDEPQYA